MSEKQNEQTKEKGWFKIVKGASDNGIRLRLNGSLTLPVVYGFRR